MKKFLAALMIGSLFFATTADAEVRTFKATGEDSATKIESQEVVKVRALDRAIKNALAQAGETFKTSGLAEEEISAIILNGYEIIGAAEYEQVGNNYRATVELGIDDAQIENWIRRDDMEKFALTNAAKETQKLFTANDARLEDLRERAANMKKQDKKFFTAEFNYVNNEFLSNQKVEAGNKFAYKGRFDDAIKLYTEAITQNEYNAAAYNRRGQVYSVMAANQKVVPMAESYRRQAINDLDKATRLNNNYAEAFANRGFVYYNGKFYGQAIKDFNRAIQLEPDNAWNYIYRAQCNRPTDKNLALADFNKAIELNPKNSRMYSARGDFYEQDLSDFSKAAADYTQAIELERREELLALNYQNRGDLYRKQKTYGKAIDDYTRAIELIERSAQKPPLLAWIYRKRGECYQAVGDGAHSQADFKKFDELQRR